MAATLLHNTELRRFTRNPLTIAALVIVAAIPLLYGALYLWAFWNPTGHLDKLPIALVVEDRGAKDQDGKPVHAGDEVAKSIIEKKTMQWHKTDAADAATGLADGDYLAVVTIPQNFSSSVVTAGTDNAHPAALQVRYNDANGYTARTLVSSVMRELRAAVSDSLGEQMVDQVLVGLGEIHDNLVKAADGAHQVKDGSVQARDGSARLDDGASELATGAQKLSSGADQLAVGAEQAKDGASDLAAGAHKLDSGARQLDSGAERLDAGLQTLQSSSAQLPSATAKLADGSRQVADGNAKVAGVVGTAADRVDAVADRATALQRDAAAARQRLVEQLQAQVEANPSDTAAAALLATLQDGTFETAISDVTATAADLRQAADQARTDTARLAAGSEQVAQGNAALAASAPKLVDGISQAATGAHQLSAGTSELTSGTSALASGADRLSSGLVSLDSGADELAQGARTLSGGAGELFEGATSLHTGLVKLADGSSELSSGLDDGVAQIPTYTENERTANAETMSNPVDLATSFLHEASGNGEGFAPYFIGLALYVGAMILWMVLRPISLRSLSTSVSATKVTWMSLQPALALGAVQSMLLLAVLVFGLGLDPRNALAVIVFLLAVSLAFITLQQAIGVAFGSPGRILVLVLLMLQLTSAGGTYPAEMTPTFFQRLHGVLPMTQVVNGLREAITGSLDHRFWVALTYLLVMAAVSFGAACLAAARKRVWTMSGLHPAVQL